MERTKNIKMDRLNELKANGWYLTEDGLKKILDIVGINANIKSIIDTALDMDFRDIAGGALQSLGDSKVPTNIVLQLQKIQDAASPKANEETKSDGTRTLVLDLTDGQTTLYALEIEHIDQLNKNLPPGTKIHLLKNSTKLIYGQLFLYPKQIQVLGGKVQALIHKWELARTMQYYSNARPQHNTTNGPPAWIAFNKSTSTATITIAGKTTATEKNFKSLKEAGSSNEKENKGNDDFNAFRSDAIAKANSMGNKKYFKGNSIQIQINNTNNNKKVTEYESFNNKKNSSGGNGKIRQINNNSKTNITVTSNVSENNHKSINNDYINAATHKPAANVSLSDFLTDKLPPVRNKLLTDNKTEIKTNVNIKQQDAAAKQQQQQQQNTRTSVYNTGKFENNMSSSFVESQQNIEAIMNQNNEQKTINNKINKNINTNNKREQRTNNNQQQQQQQQSYVANTNNNNNNLKSSYKINYGKDSNKKTTTTTTTTNNNITTTTTSTSNTINLQKTNNTQNNNKRINIKNDIQQQQLLLTNTENSKNYVNTSAAAAAAATTTTSSLSSNSTQNSYGRNVVSGNKKNQNRNNNNNNNNNNMNLNNNIRINKTQNKIKTNGNINNNIKQGLNNNNEITNIIKDFKSLEINQNNKNTIIPTTSTSIITTGIKNSTTTTAIPSTTTTTTTTIINNSCNNNFDYDPSKIMGFQCKETNDIAKSLLKDKEIKTQQQQQQQPKQSQPPTPTIPSSTTLTAIPITTPQESQQSQQKVDRHIPDDKPTTSTSTTCNGFISESTKPWEWKIGEICMAKYWDDNCFYEAKITGLSDNTCVVYFLNYGNHEEVMRTDCLSLRDYQMMNKYNYAVANTHFPQNVLSNPPYKNTTPSAPMPKATSTESTDKELPQRYRSEWKVYIPPPKRSGV